MGATFCIVALWTLGNRYLAAQQCVNAKAGNDPITNVNAAPFET